MQDEIAGQAIEPPPWPEARPPHLPDRLTAVPARVWPFMIVAAVLALHGWYRWSRGGTATPLDLLADVGPAIAASLIGAALFLRHPDAHRSVPYVAVGAVLFATREVLRIAAPFVDDFLTALLPADPDGLKPFMPHEYVYVWLTLLVLAAAAAFTARGLDSAREFGEAISRRVIGVVLAILAVLSTAGTAGMFMSSPQASIDGVLTAIGLATNLIVTLAWIYLFTVVLGGSLARERPRLAWGLAALGTGLYLFLDLLIGAIDFIALQAGTDALILAVTILDLGWVALLLAFVAGLPAVRADPREGTPPGSGAG